MRQLLQKIEALKKKVENVDKMVDESCTKIASRAQGLALPGISVTASGKTITASGKWAAYVEFGTGQYAEKHTALLPDEWDDYAMKFYVDGKGKIPDVPYLFPAFEEGRVELIKQIKESFK